MKKIYSLLLLALVVMGAVSCNSDSNDIIYYGEQVTITRSFPSDDLSVIPESSTTIVALTANVSAGTAELTFTVKLASNTSVTVKATGLSMTTNASTGCYEFKQSGSSQISAGQNTITDLEGLINSSGGSIRLSMIVNGTYHVYITSPDYLYTNTVISTLDNSSQPYEASDIYYEFVPDFTTMTGQLYIAHLHLSSNGVSDNVTVLGLPFEVTPEGFKINELGSAQLSKTRDDVVKELSDFDITISNQGQSISGSFVANDNNKVTFHGTVFPAQYK